MWSGSKFERREPENITGSYKVGHYLFFMKATIDYENQSIKLKSYQYYGVFRITMNYN
jgi:hypothetical protein